MDAQEFLKRVSGRAGLHNRDQAHSAVDAVFDALRSRIYHETGDNITSQLPMEIRQMWESGTFEHVLSKVVGFERLDLEEFLNKVEDKLHLEDIYRARVVTQAVFMTLQEAITPGAADKISQGLPRDLRELWENSKPAEHPSETPQHERMLREQAGVEPQGAWTGETQPQRPALEEEYELPEGPELESIAGEPQPKPPPEGEYGSEEIGPAAASVYRSDDQLKSEIIELLDANDELDASSINVEVHAGKVTLRGVVQTPDQRNIAEHVASDALGTVEIIDELHILEKDK